jgi:hypothetical protein
LVSGDLSAIRELSPVPCGGRGGGMEESLSPPSIGTRNLEPG